MNTPASGPVRPWLLVVLGVVLLAGVGVAARSAWRAIAARKAQVTAVKAARDERQSVRVHPVPAPLPTSIPLIGPVGTDADGYPRQYVDRPALRALLAAQHFDELNAYIEQLQAAFEADPRKEYWPSDAADTFGSAEPDVVPALDAWVAETPGSFAPYLAQGSHYVGAAWARRGAKFRSQTPDDDIKAMDNAAKRAIADLDRAIALRPKLVAAMRQEMLVALPTSDNARAATMSAAAFAACPGCLQVRAAYLNTLTPRWGGSYEAIESFVSTLSPSVNPRFRALRGYADFDRASAFDPKGSPLPFASALVDVDRALGFGEYWEFLFYRAVALRALARFDEALVAIDRADALRPMTPTVLSERAALHCNRKEFVAAGRDLLVALRTNPAEPDGKRYATDVINGLMSTAQASDAAGGRGEAMEALQLVLALCPDHEAARALQTQLGGADASSP
jgi:tetratricopeptide (TPR) repeat protein